MNSDTQRPVRRRANRHERRELMALQNRLQRKAARAKVLPTNTSAPASETQRQD